MHLSPQARDTEQIWRISPKQIDATVSEFLGPRRLEGNSREPMFSRQVSMYLALHVGGWGFPKITQNPRLEASPGVPGVDDAR